MINQTRLILGGCFNVTSSCIFIGYSEMRNIKTAPPGSSLVEERQVRDLVLQRCGDLGY